MQTQVLPVLLPIVVLYLVCILSLIIVDRIALVITGATGTVHTRLSNWLSVATAFVFLFLALWKVDTELIPPTALVLQLCIIVMEGASIFGFLVYMTKSIKFIHFIRHRFD